MALDIDRAIVDYIKTFNKPAIFLSIEPKLVRADKDDANSPQVQGRDSTGALKWTCIVAVPVKSFDRERFVNLSITLTSASQPCKDIQPGQQVVPEGGVLEMGLMKQDRGGGGVSQFWSAAGIKPVAAQPAARSQAASS